MNNKLSKNKTTNLSKSDFIDGENMSPDDFDMQNKDNSSNHVNKPKKNQ